MGISVAMVGTGAFAQGFIPLFQAHPLVERIALCDLDAEKLGSIAGIDSRANVCYVWDSSGRTYVGISWLSNAATRVSGMQG